VRARHDFPHRAIILPHVGSWVKFEEQVRAAD
jgi:hypothetical protein